MVSYGRFADAGKLIDRIPEAMRQTLLGPLYSEILFQTHQTDSALSQARAATEADPKNAQNQYWYGSVASAIRAGDRSEAGATKRENGKCDQGNAASD